MPTDRVLVEIVTAANMTGIKEAQAGFLGMSNALSAALVGLGVLVVAGKSAVEIAEKHQKAERDLAQALEVTNGSYAQASRFLDDFIQSNRRYVKDQSEVIDSYALLARAGLSQTEVQRDLNIALDLSALKHISLNDAVTLVNQAEHGRLRGLVDLGITSKAYVDSAGNVIEANKNMAKVMAELEAKTKDGRKSTTEMDQATTALGNDWQDIANNVGPPLVGMLDGILQATDWLIQKLKELGANKEWNKTLSEGFGAVQGYITNTVQGIRDLIAGVQWLIDHGQAVANFLGGSGNSSGHSAPTRYSGMRASGGPVLPGGRYIVGERGPETLVMGSSGGLVLPNGSGGANQVHVHLEGIYAGDGPSLDILANKIALRLGYATGR